MLDSLQAGIWRLLGREVDPLGTITPEQLKAVLKSIEGKYNSLRDENKRLKGVIEEHVETIERLKADLKEARESLTPKGAEVLQRQRDDLQSQLEELQRMRMLERAQWEGKISELENKLIDQERQRSDADAYLESLEERQQVDLLRMREEISRLEAQVARQAADTEIRDRLDSEKQTLRARVEELTAERDQLEARLQELERSAAARQPVAPRPEPGPTVSSQAADAPPSPASTPDRRELLARLLGGERP